jgi:hypothetical protein
MTQEVKITNVVYMDKSDNTEKIYIPKEFRGKKDFEIIMVIRKKEEK